MFFLFIVVDKVENIGLRSHKKIQLVFYRQVADGAFEFLHLAVQHLFNGLAFGYGFRGGIEFEQFEIAFRDADGQAMFFWFAVFSVVGRHYFVYLFLRVKITIFWPIRQIILRPLLTRSV